MTLEDILEDIHTLGDELRSYERKHGVLSETFYDAYAQGEEPASPAWVRHWTAWASAYTLRLRRREQYRAAIQVLRMGTETIAQVIGKTAEPAAVPA